MRRIGPVEPEQTDEALRFLAGGRTRGPVVRARAESYGELLRRERGGAALLWQAGGRTGRQAVALVVRSPGKTGMLYHSPAGAPGVEAEALAALIAAVSAQALAEGLSLVQSLLAAPEDADVPVLLAAGYRRLAELIYLRRDLRQPPDPPALPALRWRTYSEFDEGELAEVIAATYRDSLDCPALSGLRDLADVIAGHKAAGVFCPETWWIVDRCDAPAGCLLVNESVLEAAADIVYMGAVPSQRRAGLGRAMLRWAACEAFRRRHGAILLTVDAANEPARGLYASEGFRPTHRRLAYALLRPPRDAQKP